MDHKLWVLQTTLQPLVSWRHDSMEVVVLCCNLLKLVMEKHTSEVALARQLVFLLCRIAFRHQVRGIKARADLLDPEMLRKLTAFVGDGNVEFINDLMTAFTSISWDEHKQGHIIWTVIDIPSTLLSPTSQSALQCRTPLLNTRRGRKSVSEKIFSRFFEERNRPKECVWSDKSLFPTLSRVSPLFRPKKIQYTSKSAKD